MFKSGNDTGDIVQGEEGDIIEDDQEEEIDEEIPVVNDD